MDGRSSPSTFAFTTRPGSSPPVSAPHLPSPVTPDPTASVAVCLNVSTQPVHPLLSRRGGMRRALLCAVLAVLSGPSSAGAQSLMLSESDALARLSNDSPRVRAVRTGVELTRADVLAANRWP